MTPESNQNGEKELILFVEDEDDLRMLFAEGLDLFGMDVLQAADGELGWELFQQHSENIIAVITDVYMPKMNGIDLLNRVKSLRPEIPVIMITAYAKHHHNEIKMECDVAPDAFLQKPFQITGLIDVLKELVPGKFVEA